MTTLTRWERSFIQPPSPLRGVMSRFFEDATPPHIQASVRPLALDMYEAQDEMVVRAALPGFEEKDVEVTVEHGSLTIRARHVEEAGHVADHQDEGHRWILREVWPGEYGRSIVLPSGLQPEKSEASFTNGVLTMRIPKAEAAKPRQIKINGKSA